jgi:hypothetical protein
VLMYVRLERIQTPEMVADFCLDIERYACSCEDH